VASGSWLVAGDSVTGGLVARGLRPL